MRSKERFVLFLLFIVFLITAGMFYYQNMYLKQKDAGNQVPVFMAIKDIPEGATFSKQNFGQITLEKTQVDKLTNYIPVTVKGLASIEGKVANSNILKNEIITKERIDNQKTKEDTFKVLVQPAEKVTVEQGDLVNIYLQLTREDKTDKTLIHYETYSIAKKKVVKDVIFKKNSSGKIQEGVVDYLRFTLSEQESLNYHLAKQIKSAKIIVVPYENILNKDDAQVADFSKIPGYQDAKDNLVKNGQANIQKQVDGSTNQTTQPMTQK